MVYAVLGGVAGPFISAALLAIRQAGRRVAQHTRTRRKTVTRHLRIGRACSLAAVLLGIGATDLATQDEWLFAAALAYGTLVAGLGARVEYGSHRRVLEQHEWARRHALGEEPLAPLDPCCPLWRMSRTVHAPDCTDVRFRAITAQLTDLDTRDSA